jgi:hypothetical protein
MHLLAALAAHPATQQTPTQPVDVHNHELFGLFNLGHGVRLQPQLFSDKSFYKHLGPFPSLCSGEQLRRIEAGRGAAQLPADGISFPSKAFNSNYTFRRGTQKDSRFHLAKSNIHPGPASVASCPKTPSQPPERRIPLL